MIKGKKSIALLLVLMLAMTMMVGCSANEPAPTPEESGQEASNAEPLNVVALKGPTAMGMAKMMSDSEENGAYNFQIVGAADEIVGKITTGEVDIAAVPANLASVLYNKTEGKISVAAINTLGVLYVVEKGDTIQSIADLKGKTILSTGKGTTPEYVLNYILTSNGLDPEKDVTVEYKTEASEVATLLESGEATIAMLPQPFVTTVMNKNPDLRVALDITEQWELAQGENPSQLVTGTVIVRNEVLENNKEAVDAFLADYKTSTEFINNNVDEGAKLVAKYDIAPEPVAKKAIPACNIVYIDGVDMQKYVGNYLQILFDANPKAVGGKLPAEEFYYVK